LGSVAAHRIERWTRPVQVEPNNLEFSTFQCHREAYEAVRPNQSVDHVKICKGISVVTASRSHCAFETVDLNRGCPTASIWVDQELSLIILDAANIKPNHPRALTGRV
jgi:hypothetical protein